MDVKGKGRATEEHEEIGSLVFASPIAGKVIWNVKPGQVITNKQTCVVQIVESCSHPVQLGGLCAVCGKDLTATDFTGYSDLSRATVNMSHHHSQLTVSHTEAERLEAQTTARLLKQRKLSLIVDLDQTIIQATVDPTVEVWSKDPSNPNYSALQDVKRFKLSMDGSQTTEGDAEGCWYYIKPRPGLADFLQRSATLYEMHVYTMGTRNYAENVCKIVDPDGTLFGGRILSRDESGSITLKSLQRLFPVDTSMVVVIDDRADVWNHVPNLLKVIPFDFFVGIGDINAAHLPKKNDIRDSLPAAENSQPPESDAVVTDQQKEESDAEAIRQAAATKSIRDTLEHQIQDRPLLKQAQDEAAKGHHTGDPAHSATNGSADDHEKEPRSLTRESSKTDVLTDTDSTPSQTKSETISISMTPSQDSVVSSVLKDNDEELARIQKLLDEVHRNFYALQKGSERTEVDVKTIIIEMRKRVLQGVNLVFSSVIPLGQVPAQSEIWQLSESFGASCFEAIDGSTTHVVTAKDGTLKVADARRRRHIKLVWLAWLLESMALWKRQDETNFTLDKQPIEGSDGDGLLASDVEPTEDSAEPIFSQAIHDADTIYIEAEENEGEHGASQIFGQVDWNSVDAELAELLNESDTESLPRTPARKRGRSKTPPADDSDSKPPTPSQKRLRRSKEDSPQVGSQSSSIDTDDEDGFLDSMAAQLNSEMN